MIANVNLEVVLKGDGFPERRGQIYVFARVVIHRVNRQSYVSQRTGKVDRTWIGAGGEWRWTSGLQSLMTTKFHLYVKLLKQGPD